MRISIRLALAVICLFTTVAFASPSSTRLSAPDAHQPGSFLISTAEYKFPAQIDAEVLAGTATELWARAFWPKDLSRPRPILFLLHGNHATCSSGCGYTYEGSCGAGQTVVLNHEGYNYLGERLATHGYIVVTINANRGITCNSGNQDDFGLNLARGRLVLRHIERWSKWATQGGLPASMGSDANLFVNAVDLSNVGFMGHSRGGEGVRAAYNLYRDRGSAWPARIPGLNIRGIYEIGAVDGQTSRVLDADDTAWNQLLPMCDGDVSDLQGRLPFERMILKKSEVRKTPKSLTMAWGTNHNFYNTEWTESDAYGCEGHEPIYGNGPTSEAQKNIALSSMTAFFLANVGETLVANQGLMFDPLAKLPISLSSITRIDRDHIPTSDEQFDMRVEEFDQPTGRNTYGAANEANGVDVSHDKNDQPARASVVWKHSGPDRFFQVNWAKAGEGKDISSFANLDFRIARQHSRQSPRPSTDLSIQLVDARGRVSSAVSLSAYDDVLGPANSVTTFQTIRIPLVDFGFSRSTQIRGVRFVFDRSGTGEIYLANVRFSSLEQAIPFGSRFEPMTSTDSQPTSDRASLSNRGQMTVASTSTNVAFNTALRVAPREDSATVIGARSVSRSRYLSGGAGVEIAVRASKTFPVQNSLPFLTMSGQTFANGRYQSNGRLDTLIFSIEREKFDRLPRQGSMKVHYGMKNPLKIWNLPDYDKSRLDQ